MTREFGIWGENLACELLMSKGYAIIARNERVAHVEIDIIAQLGNRIVIVEVKTRQTADQDPLFGIDNRKIKRLARAAEAYVQIHDLPHEIQIDVILIVGTPQDGHTIEHIPDAFLPPWRSVVRHR